MIGLGVQAAVEGRAALDDLAIGAPPYHYSQGERVLRQVRDFPRIRLSVESTAQSCGSVPAATASKGWA
jgi:hypothetical protein